MSLGSLTDLAVRRDRTPHKGALPTRRISADRRERRAGEAAQKAPASLGEVVVAAVPTEVVAVYTAALLLVQPLVPADEPGEFVPLRWSLFAAGAVLTVAGVVVLYLRKRSETTDDRRRFPGAELATSLVAFVAWGLTVPTSALNAVLPVRLQALVTGLLLLGVGALLSLVAHPLQAGSNTSTAVADVEAEAAAQEAAVQQAAAATHYISQPTASSVGAPAAGGVV